MALRAIVKSDAGRIVSEKSSVSQLFRSMIKELPRVMTLYDIDIPLKDARKAVQFHFRKNAHLEDPRVINVLLAKGYMELEETLMQWKQKSHLLNVLEPYEWSEEYKLAKEEEAENEFPSVLTVDGFEAALANAQSLNQR